MRTTRIGKLAAVALLAGALSLGTFAPAQAFDFSMGDALDLGAGLAAGIAVSAMTRGGDDRPVIDVTTKGRLDSEWDDLVKADGEIHAAGDKVGWNVLIQKRHDCNRAQKIKNLIDLMVENRNHYRTLTTLTAAEHKKLEDDENADIAKWTIEYKQALKECSKRWY